MRKWISIVLVLSLVTMLTGVASAIEAGEDVAPALYTSSGEEKVYCNATVEDDFAENRIMVVLSNDASLHFNAYEAADFSEIDCTGVQDLSQASGRKIQAKAEAVKAAVMTRSVDVSTLDTSGIDTYNQVLCLELEESGKENVLAAIDELMARDDVVYAGPDYVMELCAATPGGKSYYDGGNWATNVIDLPQAWDITTGSSEVVVGVIDSGIDASHEDLKDNINTEMSFDFLDASSEETTDPEGHGTHVAGIIGAVGNNDIGTAGVCWNVTLVSLRAFDENRLGYSSSVADAIQYAEGLDIPIINLSAGWYAEGHEGYYDMALESVIRNYSGLLVCSAGNEGFNIDGFYYYPASFDLPNLITVGASNSQDEKWINLEKLKSSNYGQTTVDLFAPGGDIYSTKPDDTYDTHGGTSMATPYVTGVAALLLSQYPDLLPCEIKDTILSSVDDCGTTFDNLCVSGGRVNAYNALTNVIRHTKTIIDNGYDGGHTDTCTQCQYSENHAHYFENISMYNAFQHTIACDCGNTTYESHLWNGARTRCLVCGYDNSGLGVIQALKPDDE